MRDLWENRVQSAVEKEIDSRVFAAFNTNVDVVVHLDNAAVSRLLDDPEIVMEEVNQKDSDSVDMIRTKTDFTAVLKDCLGKGKSFYIVLADMELLDWLDSVFTKRKESMGGQAGIIANQMAALQADSIVYTSLLSPKQVEMFFPEVHFPMVNGALSLVPIGESARPGDNLKINWIFEYAKGEAFDFDGETIETPRANRVILATRPEGVVMGFTGDVADHLPEFGGQMDVAFMAGYHYAPTDRPELDDYVAKSMGDLHKLKEGNPELLFHYEYVPMKDEDAEKYVLRSVAQEIQSFGINENEIRRVLQEFGFEAEYQDVVDDERAFSLYQGALRISEELGFERIQVHNFGYYVLVLKKSYPVSPEKVREACLYASSVNAMKAKYGGYVQKDTVPEAAELGLSDIGVGQLEGFAKEMAERYDVDADQLAAEGIYESDDHVVVVVPAHVYPHPVSTVGMGDTISSSSYACEASLRRSPAVSGD